MFSDHNPQSGNVRIATRRDRPCAARLSQRIVDHVGMYEYDQLGEPIQA
jgi:hypothetical protein